MAHWMKALAAQAGDQSLLPRSPSRRKEPKYANVIDWQDASADGGTCHASLVF